MAKGDSTAAVASCEAALATWTREDLPFEAARARYELARALAPTRPDGAIDQARLALTSFEDLGATLEADRTAALLRAMGVTARTGAKGVGTLTNREQEVLALLGHGLSNPEIAPAPAREPQDRVAPRQQRPVQAEPAQPGRGGGLRRRRDGTSWLGDIAPARLLGQLPDAPHDERAA